MSDYRNYTRKILICIDCQIDFPYEPTEQAYMAKMGYEEPKRCHDCRSDRKAAKEAAKLTGQPAFKDSDSIGNTAFPVRSPVRTPTFHHRPNHYQEQNQYQPRRWNAPSHYQPSAPRQEPAGNMGLVDRLKGEITFLKSEIKRLKIKAGEIVEQGAEAAQSRLPVK